MEYKAFAVLLLALLTCAHGVTGSERSQSVEETVYETATLTGFAGRSFGFSGEPNTTYVLLSETKHQLVARFQRSVESRRVTNYIDAIGLSCRNHTVLVQVEGNRSLSVLLDGQPLHAPAEGEQLAEYSLVSQEPAATLSIVWQVSASSSSVILRTELLAVVMFVEPGVAADSQTLAQPAFLNFDIALLDEPAGGSMQGAIGETYARLLAGPAANLPGHPLFQEDDDQFHGSVRNYAVSGFFEAVGARGSVTQWFFKAYLFESSANSRREVILQSVNLALLGEATVGTDDAKTIVNSILGAYGLPLLKATPGFRVHEDADFSYRFEHPRSWVVRKNTQRAGVYISDFQTADKAVLEVVPDANLPDDARVEEVVERLVSPGSEVGGNSRLVLPDTRRIKVSDSEIDGQRYTYITFPSETITRSGYQIKRKNFAVAAARRGCLYCLVASARGDQYSPEKESTLRHIVDSFRLRA
ncbi:hypothetical protein WJX81_007150 [Elliptochloris bilobata]|uniref:PsbP C-terminal domain-containing protein n=1 Tax=Elliptochloris bilobata TaxID=381761 RepID=A0AAW1QMK6_9CHLO